MVGVDGLLDETILLVEIVNHFPRALIAGFSPREKEKGRIEVTETDREDLCMVMHVLKTD